MEYSLCAKERAIIGQQFQFPEQEQNQTTYGKSTLRQQ